MEDAASDRSGPTDSRVTGIEATDNYRGYTQWNCDAGGTLDTVPMFVPGLIIMTSIYVCIRCMHVRVSLRERERRRDKFDSITSFQPFPDLKYSDRLPAHPGPRQVPQLEQAN